MTYDLIKGNFQSTAIGPSILFPVRAHQLSSHLLAINFNLQFKERDRKCARDSIAKV